MRPGSRRQTRALGTVVWAALAAVGMTLAGPSAASAPGSEDLLRHPARGTAAVQRLDDDLPRAAALNGMDVGSFERLLLRDATAWVDTTGRLLYIDREPTITTVEPPARAPYPYDETFRLHSNPGSSRTIYLDFDGQTISGTAWNDEYDLPAATYPPFSRDADGSTFDKQERDVIQSVWQRVSEDYAPFDVDVTTADPGLESLRRSSVADTVFGTRALVTPSLLASRTLCTDRCGGVGYFGTFDAAPASDSYQPAWVFPQNLSWDTKAIAETVSHEVGHNLALVHDGIPGDDYYDGHGAWAPIMGGGNERPITQWSKGEYAKATSAQDDLLAITQHGLTPLPDDHGDAVPAATVVASADRTATGLVSTRADRDVFAFTQGCTGHATVAVSPAPTSPDLDVRLRLLSPAGAELAVDDPMSAAASTDIAIGLGAVATTSVTSGTTVYAEVDGVGAADPVTDGYSDYGSLGRYTVVATGCGGGTVSFEDAARSVLESAGTVLLSVVRTGTTTAPASVAYAVTGGTATQGTDYDLAAGTLMFAAGASRASIPVRVTGDYDAEGDETVQVTLSSPSGDATMGTVATSTVTITDDDGSPAQPDLLVSARRVFGYVGAGVYNNTGRGQTVTQKAHRGEARTFYVRLANDGPRTSAFTLWGCEPSRGSTVTYTYDGTDVTPWMTSPGGVPLELGTEESALLRVDLRVGRNAVIGSTRRMQVTAVSDAGEVLTDVVRGVVTVVRR